MSVLVATESPDSATSRPNTRARAETFPNAAPCTPRSTCFFRLEGPVLAPLPGRVHSFKKQPYAAGLRSYHRAGARPGGRAVILHSIRTLE